MAGPGGFEPPNPALEAGGLPLSLRAFVSYLVVWLFSCLVTEPPDHQTTKPLNFCLSVKGVLSTLRAELLQLQFLLGGAVLLRRIV